MHKRSTTLCSRAWDEPQDLLICAFAGVGFPLWASPVPIFYSFLDSAVVTSPQNMMERGDSQGWLLHIPTPVPSHCGSWPRTTGLHTREGFLMFSFPGLSEGSG